MSSATSWMATVSVDRHGHEQTVESQAVTPASIMLDVYVLFILNLAVKVLQVGASLFCSI